MGFLYSLVMSIKADAITKALLLAIKYIEERDTFSPEGDDVRALEEISAVLMAATVDEKECLFQATRDLGMPDLPEQMGLT